MRRIDSSNLRLTRVILTGASLASALLAGTPGTSRAQEAPATESTGVLQEVTVTATRREESLSKVPVSVTALTQESLDERGVKDFSEVARFTPGVNFDNSGTNNISIRGISGNGGAGTTGIYLDDTPIQMRGLAFNPDEALPKSFDIERVEVLRGPQGTLFGAGSEGGTVRYITVQPSLTKTSIYGRSEFSATRYGDPSYEAGGAIGGPLVQGTLGARLAVSYRRDGGWIDRMDPVSRSTVEKNANYVNTLLVRLAAVWAPSDKWTLTPGIYYQNQLRNDINNYWPLYSNPASGSFIDADPSKREVPDKFYLTSLRVQGDLGPAQLISNTSYYHRREQTGYEGTLYNLGFYQTFMGDCSVGGTGCLLDNTGVHLPTGATDYRSPSTVDNGQQNITQEVRLQSSDPNARLLWTTGVFVGVNRQSYLEQIHDPQLQELITAITPGSTIVDVFGVGYDPQFPTDSYFLKTDARDEQYAVFGELSYNLTERLKGTAGARFSRNKYSFDTLTGGPQLFAATTPGSGNNAENAFTPRLGLQFQADPNDMYYLTYAKGYRPGGANNPLPPVACAQDFIDFGITAAPTTYSSDSVNSFEVGAKNNIANRVKLATSLYYIRWNNIQQTVVPPICQISFIDNLGKAVAKGADLQADIALTERFTIELAAGYTDARYIQDSKLSPTSTTGPVVANGDAITSVASELGGGQPTAPVTVTAGVEYKFSAFSHATFVRADAGYLGRAKWPTPQQDASTLQSDHASFVLPGTTHTSVRGGIDLGGWQLAAFVDNLTNVHPLTDYNYTICPPTSQPACLGSERLQRAYTFRPRTYGLTAIFRQ
jgi:outer membrane receptor protein involved in Fe transport